VSDEEDNAVRVRIAGLWCGGIGPEAGFAGKRFSCIGSVTLRVTTLTCLVCTVYNGSFPPCCTKTGSTGVDGALLIFCGWEANHSTSRTPQFQIRGISDMCIAAETKSVMR